MTTLPARPFSTPVDFSALDAADITRPMAALHDAIMQMGLDPVSVGPVDPALARGLIAMPGAWAAAYANETCSARRTDLRRLVVWTQEMRISVFASAVEFPGLVSEHLACMAEHGSPEALRRASSHLASIVAELGLPTELLAARNRLLVRAKNRAARSRCNITRKSHRRLTRDEMEVFFKTIESAPGPELRRIRDLAITRLMCGLMLRRSELCDLRLIDWDPAAQRITIAHGKTDQEGQGTTYSLKASAVEALEDWLTASGLGEIEGDWVRARTPMFVALRKNGTLALGVGGDLHHLNGSSVARILRGHAKRAGLFGVSGHTPRRSVARILIDAKVEDAAVMKAGRWSRRETMRHYAGRPAAETSAAELLDAL